MAALRFQNGAPTEGRPYTFHSLLFMTRVRSQEGHRVI